MSDSLIGRTLGKYRILDKLGQGGMGMVYKALQPSLNRTVAIKVLPAQLAMDPEFVHRFRQEAQVIASLQHESIVHVYDIDEAELGSGEKLYFIVMELVDGQTLRQWLGRGQALPPAEVQRIGGDLARALDYAHQRGIVHRDVKTANVMVTRDARVKLMDFGIAKSAGGVRTMTGSVLGTPEYMAPEQARSGKVTAQSDIYSLGVLLYELAAGRVPFTGEDAFSIALQHLSKEPPRPREVNPAVPEWLERIILKAMAKEPADRYASAGQLGGELRAGGPPSPAAFAAADTDTLAPTLAVGVTPPGWPAAASWPGGVMPGSPSDFQATTPLPRPQAGHPPGTPLPSTTFGAAPPGPGLPPTPPGSYPPPGGSATPTPHAGPAWGAAGAYVPPTPPPAAAGWQPPAPPPVQPPPVPPPPAVPYPSLPGAFSGPPAAPQTGAPPPSTPAAARDQATGRKALAAVGLLALLAGGAAIGGFWSRSEQGERPRPEIVQPGANPDAPPPPPDRQQEPEQPPPPIRPAPAPPQRPAPQPPAPLPTAEVETEEAPVADTGPTAGELWSQAYRLKEDKKYHSLRQVLDRLEAKDPSYADSRDWRGDVDDWVADREKDLRGETEDLLDELIDGLGDRDADHLADQWGGRLDGTTQATADQLWSLGPKLKWTARLRTFKAWDNGANFSVVIEVADRGGRKLRDFTWNGAMADDKEGTRFTAPLR